MTGAIARAVEAFAHAEGIDEPTRDKLTEAAQIVALDDTERNGLVGTPFGAALLMSGIADWSRPTSVPSSRTLSDADAGQAASALAASSTISAIRSAA